MCPIVPARCLPKHGPGFHSTVQELCLRCKRAKKIVTAVVVVVVVIVTVVVVVVVVVIEQQSTSELQL